ncbi:zinc-binding domain-containing protein [Aspergillus recurvatus]
MPSHNSYKRKPYSTYPSLHSSVVEHLKPSGLTMAFHPVDTDEAPSRTHVLKYNTNIMGVFACYNKSCPSRGWASKMVAVTIRMYRKDGDNHNHSGKGEGRGKQPGLYNVRVYHQRCKKCTFLSRPKLDESYAERVAYRLKKWHGIEVEQPVCVQKGKAPHVKRLCEGCKAGVCPNSKRAGDGSDSESVSGRGREPR